MTEETTRFAAGDSVADRWGVYLGRVAGCLPVAGKVELENGELYDAKDLRPFYAPAATPPRYAAGPWIEGPPKAPKEGDEILAVSVGRANAVLTYAGANKWHGRKLVTWPTEISYHARINPPAKEGKS